MDPRSFSVICAACHISIGHVVWAHRIWRISSILLLLKLPCHKKKCGQKQIEHRSKHRHAHKKAVAAAIKWENLSLKYCVSTVDRQVKRSITTGGVILIYWLSSSPQKKKIFREINFRRAAHSTQLARKHTAELNSRRNKKKHEEQKTNSE